MISQNQIDKAIERAKILFSPAGFGMLKDLFFKYGVGLAILFLGLVSVYVNVMVLVHVPTANGDSVEHIHSSFLVALGYVPYRDFFQHHNPLMWFIFAPVTWFFRYDVTVSEVLSFISFMVFLKSLVYVYKISDEFLANKYWGILGGLFLCVPDNKLYAIDFRPDNYMVFALIGGIYYYFRYLRDKETKDLVISFVFFVLSFLFAQKAIFSLFVLGLTGLYFWHKKTIKTKDMLLALLCSGSLLAIFLLYLLYYKILKLYYVSNFTFNLNLAEVFEFGRVCEIPLYMKVFFTIAWVGAIGALFFKNRYQIIIAILFMSEFVQRVSYFSPYSYYYWQLLYFAVLMSLPVLKKLDDKNRLVRVMCVCGVGVMLNYSYSFYMKMIEANKDRAYMPDYIARKITPCDYVFNGDKLMYNMFARDPHYYWQLIGQLDVVGEKTGIAPKPNMNELILKYMPRFIYGYNYFNKVATELGRKEIVHYIDRELVEKYYDKTQFYGVYELKKEFVKECNILKN